MEQRTLLDVIHRDCQHCVSGISQHDPHLLTLGLERLTNHCSMISTLITQDNEANVQLLLENLLGHLQLLRRHVESNLEELQANESASRGRLHLDAAEMQELRRLGMPWSKIGKLDGASRQTVWKFRRRHSISEPNAAISDGDLCALVSGIARQHPNAGVRLMHGAIRAAGFRASRAKVWSALRVVDPIAVAARCRRRIQRKKYKVGGANDLWHMDGNHKLKMFRVYIHGCVDGFTRKIIYLNAAVNNKPEPVLAMFKAGVKENYFPHRVRADRGTENGLVERFVRQNSRASVPFIPGRSVHNVRIERLWRDVNEQVSSVYKLIFMDLEAENELDENNQLDIFLLHYVFLGRIQNTLQNFMLQWNNHCMTTLHNRAPSLEWSLYMREHGVPNYCSEDLYSSLDEFNQDDADVTWSAPYLPETAEHLREELLAECVRLLPDPFSEDGVDGKSHYKTLRAYFMSPEA